MEFKTCEQYVLAELENAQKLIEELRQQLEEKDLEIQGLEMKIEELTFAKYQVERANQQLTIEDRKSVV